MAAQRPSRPPPRSAQGPPPGKAALAPSSGGVLRDESPPQPPPRLPIAAALGKARFSPQPVDAAAARARATHEKAERFATDVSPYALLPEDGDSLRAAVSEVDLTIAAGVPLGTRKRNDNGFKWVARGTATPQTSR